MDVVLDSSEKLLEWQFMFGTLFGIVICSAIVFFKLFFKKRKTALLDQGIDLAKRAALPQNGPSPEEVWKLIDDLARLRDDLVKQQDLAKLERRLCVLLEIQAHLEEKSFSDVAENWKNGQTSDYDEDELNETPGEFSNHEGLRFYCQKNITDLQCQLAVARFGD